MISWVVYGQVQILESKILKNPTKEPPQNGKGVLDAIIYIIRLCFATTLKKQSDNRSLCEVESAYFTIYFSALQII